MKIGEYSDMIHSPYGYHLLMLTGVRDARILSLKEAGPTIAWQLAQEKREAEKKRWLKSLKKQADIVVYDKALKKTTFH
jgi:parvulin-like peptidyl-prolyl isomerase